MFKVVYSYYGKYQHERVFNTEKSAIKFFWYVQKRSGVTQTKMTEIL
jgi:hypothetical protein